MIILRKEYVLCNRVFHDVKKVNDLMKSIYLILMTDENPIRLSQGIFRKTKSYQVIIKAVAWNSKYGEVKIRIYDDKKNLKNCSRVVIENPLPKMRQIRENVLFFSSVQE